MEMQTRATATYLVISLSLIMRLISSTMRVLTHTAAVSTAQYAELTFDPWTYSLFG